MEPTKPKSGKSIDACKENCPLSKKETILKVEVKSYFWIRKEDGTLLPSSGNYNLRVRNFGAIEVLGAKVTLVEKGLTCRTTKGENKSYSIELHAVNIGKKYAPAEFHIKPALDKKETYTLLIEPHEDRRSTGPAGKSTKGKVSTSDNDLEARMYRSTKVFVQINDLGKAVKAWVPWTQNAEKSNSQPKDKKPTNVKPWEWNFANAWVEGESSDTVYVDLKPDWWSGFSKKNVDRKKRLNKDKVDSIDLISLHNTGACSDGEEHHFIWVGKPPRNVDSYKSIGAALQQGMSKNGFAGHYYVDLDGHVVKIYDEKTLVTMHTDKDDSNHPPKCNGTWLGTSTNSRSIGIETARPWNGFQEWNENGHTTKPLDHLRQAQFESMVRLIKDLQSTEVHGTEKEAHVAIPRHRIIGHSDGGYGHNGTCPGCDYWWELLEKKGLGMIFPDDLTGEIVPDPYPNEYPEYIDWFKKKGNKLVKDSAADVVSKIIQDLKDIGYEVRGQTFQSAAFAIERFQRHFYSGSRYHFRYWVLEERDKWQKGALDGREGQTPSSIEVDRRLALGIMAVANFVRQSERQWNQMQQLRKSQQRLEKLDLKF